MEVAAYDSTYSTMTATAYEDQDDIDHLWCLGMDTGELSQAPAHAFCAVAAESVEI